MKTRFLDKQKNNKIELLENSNFRNNQKYSFGLGLQKKIYSGMNSASGSNKDNMINTIGFDKNREYQEIEKEVITKNVKGFNNSLRFFGIFFSIFFFPFYVLIFTIIFNFKILLLFLILYPILIYYFLFHFTIKFKGFRSHNVLLDKDNIIFYKGGDLNINKNIKTINNDLYKENNIKKLSKFNKKIFLYSFLLTIIGFIFELGIIFIPSLIVFIITFLLFIFNELLHLYYKIKKTRF